MSMQKPKYDGWGPPVDDVIKINFDASYNQQSCKSSSGIITRNNEGMVVTVAEEMGFQDVCVEGDVLTVIRKLNFAEEDRSSISSLIKEIKGRAPKLMPLLT
ncbi:hypothetical protein Gorai_002949, partial [Gossypium raimondii]|nr:hypothetical protein [Gossypium raimondii]